MLVRYAVVDGVAFELVAAQVAVLRDGFAHKVLAGLQLIHLSHV